MCQFWSDENICFGIGVSNNGRFTNIRKSSCFLNFCGDNGFVYTDNRNIKGDCLYQDGLHLLDTGKKILEPDFICFELMFFRNEYTPFTRKILIKEGNIGLVSSGFEVLRENRLKYVNNPLIGYLNIYSLRNKIVVLREIILELSLDYLVLSETKFDQSVPRNFT